MQKYDGQLETLIVDDHSTDGTKEICESLGFKTIQNPENQGLAATLNKGVQLSKSEVVVTLHGDATPLSPDWLTKLVTPLEREGVGASCSLQYSPDIDIPGFSLWEKLLWGKVLPHHALNNKADAYKKQVLDQIGLFDQMRFRTAGEDEDMGLRLRIHGWNLEGTEAQIKHNHRFANNPGWKIFRSIIAKEYMFGRAGGALRRKFPGHKPGAFVYPKPKSVLGDGAFRVLICLGCLVPYLQLVCIPGLLGMSLIGVKSCQRRTHLGFHIIAYPFFNIVRYWIFSLGYIHGVLSGKQR